MIDIDNMNVLLSYQICPIKKILDSCGYWKWREFVKIKKYILMKDENLKYMSQKVVLMERWIRMIKITSIQK